MALRGKEQTSDMLDWLKTKGKAALVLVKMLSHLPFLEALLERKGFQMHDRTDSDIKDH